MSRALGQLPNAPLIYVLAHVRFGQIPKIDRVREDIHEKLFADFPVSREEKVQALTMRDGAPDLGEVKPRWHYLSADRTKGVILSSDSLVFHTTAYVESPVFFADFREVVSHCEEVFPQHVRVMRCGLRYVDLLVPEDGLSVDDQVVDAFRLPAVTKLGKLQRMEQVVRYSTPVGGVLVVRHRQSTTPDLLPNDIFPNDLEPPARLNRARQEGEIAGLMDYDHFDEREMDFGVEAIVDKFGLLHGVNSAAFRETTTPEAQDAWCKEEGK